MDSSVAGAWRHTVKAVEHDGTNTGPKLIIIWQGVHYNFARCLNILLENIVIPKAFPMDSTCIPMHSSCIPHDLPHEIVISKAFPCIPHDFPMKSSSQIAFPMISP
jgi:hypothetical protein